MKFRELFARLNRAQNGTTFKLIASAVVVLLAVAGVIAYAVALRARAEGSEPAPATALLVQPPHAGPPDAKRGDLRADTGEIIAEERNTALEQTRRIIEEIRAGREDATSVTIGAVVGLAIALTVIWLGLGLTYLGLVGVGGLFVLLARVIPGVRGLAPVLGGIVALTAAFTVLLRVLRLALQAPTPVFAIARNIVDEAVRMKLSLVFIVLLILGLASLPALLDPQQYLRYRVQTFLQYGVGLSYWLVAVLVLLFAAASVAFEQRDRVVWQTMTKPVAAWQYVLGKWLGITGLGGVLLLVCGAAVFLFTEYLRSQPASGEKPEQAYVAVMGDAISEDRLILEEQILAARRAVLPKPRELDAEQLRKNIDERVESEMQAGAVNFREMDAPTQAAERARIRAELSKSLVESVQLAYRTIEPGNVETYRFEGLGAAKRSARLLTLRYKINAGSNAPDALYRVTFEIRGGEPEVQRVHLGQRQVLRLLPLAIDDEGAVEVRVFNCDMPAVAAGEVNERTVNKEAISFPPDGLEISYAAGSYRANFFRVMLVLWLKLAFLAMLAVFTATFLSFPVACLVAFGTFLTAEGAGYLKASLENFADTDRAGKTIIAKRVITHVSEAVEWCFRHYASLRPTGRLVEGVQLSWGDVALGVVLLAAWTGVLYVAASLIFRRRELATYSGH